MQQVARQGRMASETITANRVIWQLSPMYNTKMPPVGFEPTWVDPIGFRGHNIQMTWNPFVAQIWDQFLSKNWADPGGADTILKNCGPRFEFFLRNVKIEGVCMYKHEFAPKMDLCAKSYS